MGLGPITLNKIFQTQLKLYNQFFNIYLLYGKRNPTPANTKAKYIPLNLSTGGDR